MIDLDTPFEPLGGVSLSPVTGADEAGLRAAADREETWRWYTYRADGPYFDTQFWPGFIGEHRPPKEVHFVVRKDGVIVGATCFLAVSEQHRRLEIGGTWYAAGVRGGVVNPVCKLLLMERAFAWGAQRVELKTDSNNARSRAAIEKLGAKYEGSLRNHMFLHDGRVRDTVYYSVVADEWPQVQARLKARIEALL